MHWQTGKYGHPCFVLKNKKAKDFAGADKSGLEELINSNGKLR